MNAITPTADRLVPVADVARRLGIVAQDIERGAYGVTVYRDWSGRPVISEADAAQIRERIETAARANRERKRAADLQRQREDQLFEDERERRYWTAYATVVEHGGAYGYREALGVAYSVISAEDPEDALRRVIEQYGEPSERAILYVMGLTSANGREKGRPRWLR